MLYVDGAYLEFGNSISEGLWFPYIYRNAGHEVGVISKITFPPKWWKLWFDDFKMKQKKRTYHELKYGKNYYTRNKYIIEDLVLDKMSIRSTIPPEAVTRLPLPEIPTPCKIPYVVFLPVAYEYYVEMRRKRWGNEKLGLGHPRRWCHALLLENWQRLADYVRSKGYLVVSFAQGESCGKKEMASFSDIMFPFSNRSIKHKNTIFTKQIRWMKNAKVTVGLSGAAHTWLCFEGIRGLGYDRKFYGPYSPLVQILRHRTDQLHFIPDPFSYLRKNMHSVFGNRMVSLHRMSWKDIVTANNTVTDLLIKELKKIL